MNVNNHCQNWHRNEPRVPVIWEQPCGLSISQHTDHAN
jgi:hypothetical protein